MKVPSEAARGRAGCLPFIAWSVTGGTGPVGRATRGLLCPRDPGVWVAVLSVWNWFRPPGVKWSLTGIILTQARLSPTGVRFLPMGVLPTGILLTVSGNP